MDMKVKHYRSTNDIFDISVFYNGLWSLCDSTFWEDQDAQVVCRQLGYKNGIAYFIPITKYSGLMKTLLMQFNCKGTEGSLRECNYTIFMDIADDYRGGVRCINESIYNRKYDDILILISEFLNGLHSISSHSKNEG